ncbi:MAG: class I SAM-dependent methyltransferase [Pirellulales bacterium]
MTSGGYDDGYAACECFWGKDPGSLVRLLTSYILNFEGLSVLDAGCGEGKNAAFLAQLGATVSAIDVSERAIANALKSWSQISRIQFEIGNVESMALSANAWDVVVMYGLLHCISSLHAIENTVRRLQSSTKPKGFNVLCAFNDRHQDLSAHPGFSPTLAPHDFYVGLYEDWNIIHVSDSDLFEVHPHNHIPHSHSLTRLIAVKA